MERVNNNEATREMSVSRMLQAPVELVWEVWTKAEHIANWWGPDGFTNNIHQMDVQPKGEWRLTMHGPYGKGYQNRSIFLEIVPLKKIVFRHFHPNYLATILFSAEENKTLMEWAMEFESPELFETVVKVFKADEGLKQNVEKLEHYLR